MPWKTLDDMELAGKRILTRVDINVPVVDGTVTDATRIQRIVPTVHDILAAGGKPVLLGAFRASGRRAGAKTYRSNSLFPRLKRRLAHRSNLPPIASAPKPNWPVRRLARARFCFWKIRGFTPVRPRMTRF